MAGWFQEEKIGVDAKAGWGEENFERLERECEPDCEGF